MSPERSILDALITLVSGVMPETSSDITFDPISGDGSTGADLESTARQMRAYEWLCGPPTPASPQMEVWRSQWTIRVRYPRGGSTTHSGDLSLLRVVEAEDVRAITAAISMGYPREVRRVSTLVTSLDEQVIGGEPIDIVTIIFSIDYIGGVSCG